MIEDRKLKVGTVLVARHKGKEHRCEVLAGEEGRVRYRLEDGREYRTPSGAGSAVMGGVACNGWRFWSVAAGEQGVKAEARRAKVATKERIKTVRSLPGRKPQTKVKGLGRNGHKPEVKWRGRVRRLK